MRRLFSRSLVALVCGLAVATLVGTFAAAAIATTAGAHTVITRRRTRDRRPTG